MLPKIGVIYVIPAIAACPVRRKSGHSANARVYECTPSPEAYNVVDYRFEGLESGTAQALLSPTAPMRVFNARRTVHLNEQESAGWQMRLSFWRGGR